MYKTHKERYLIEIMFPLNSYMCISPVSSFIIYIMLKFI